MGERFSKYVGGGVHPTTEVKLNQPLKITFVHEMAPHSQFYHPTCAYWSVSSHRWMTMGCKLLDTNSTHSRCACQRLATFALLAPPADKNYSVLNGPNSSEEQNDILVGIMAAIILVLAIVVVAILACYCRKRKVSFLIKKTLVEVLI